MATTTSLRSARKHYTLSVLIARRAAREATKARRQGAPRATVATIVTVHQATAAASAQTAVGDMLAEQDIDAVAEAMLNVLSFTTDPAVLSRMIDETDTDLEFDRLVDSIVQDAARAAESVATAVRPNIWHVRYLSPPSCARCAVLADRIYRYSEGFLRHPNCDCVMIPTTVAARNLIQDPVDLMRQGLVTGLSKADQQAILDGANFSQVVNVRRRAAGLREPGRVLSRNGRPTPEGIYRMASDRLEAVDLLRRYGYVT